MNDLQDKVTCNHCTEVLPGNHSGPCPFCGKVGKSVSVTFSGGMVMGGKFSISTMRIFYEKNTAALIILSLITLGSPFVGLALSGIPGLLIGLILGIVSFFIGLKAITKIIEHNHYN